MSFISDGRASVFKLYKRFQTLERYGFCIDLIAEQKAPVSPTKNNEITLPILGYRTNTKGPALWICAGIHGEEPAGPNGIAASIPILATLANAGQSIVLIPLANPRGYHMDWRYPNEKRDSQKGKSVGDAEHLLRHEKYRGDSRCEKPACKESEDIMSWIVTTTDKYPPILFLDHHEDEESEAGYVYSHGRHGINDLWARTAVTSLIKSGIPISATGTTRFGEKITNGVVRTTSDGSIDEFMAEEAIIVGRRLFRGPFSSSVVVIETPTKTVSFTKRVRAHANIIKTLKNLLILPLRHEKSSALA
jgi:hypothetical protein